MTKLLVIGAGRMAEAIISGLVLQPHNPFTTITAVNRNAAEKRERLKNSYGIEAADSIVDEVAGHDVVLFATPPNTHDDLLRKISQHLNGQLILTVAAGIDPDYMEKRLPEGTPAAWLMPNTSAQVGKSITTFACGTYVEERHRRVIQHIVTAIGDAEELPQEKVHDMTAITGSAPAFVYAFAEALEEAAVSYDVGPEQARKLVTQMLKGSAAMLETGEDPKALMNQVASPGGSTAEGLEVLKDRGLSSIVKEAVKAANDHARNNK